MKSKLLKIYLKDGTLIEIKKDWYFTDDFSQGMENRFSNIVVDGFIIPKVNINYIKIEDIEDEK